MGLALTMLGLIVGGALGWLLSRRSAEGALRVMEMELATARAHLSAREATLVRVEQQLAGLSQEEEQLSAVLTTTRGEFARADAVGRMLAAQVDQLRTTENGRVVHEQWTVRCESGHRPVNHARARS